MERWPLSLNNMEETLDFEKLVPFIKKALDNQGIKPDEIMQELQRQNQDQQHDQDLDNVDSSVLDNSPHTQSDVSNTEGKVLENSFKEFDVEIAIDKIKERQSYSGNAPVDKTAESLTYWDLLIKYGNNNHGRQTSPQA